MQVAALVANGAVDRSTVNAVAIDNWKVDALVGLRWRAYAGLIVGAGYGLVIVPPVEEDSSAFHPSSFAGCVDARFDVEIEQCREAIAGRGLASTAGRYSRITHRVGFSLGYSWQ